MGQIHLTTLFIQTETFETFLVFLSCASFSPPIGNYQALLSWTLIWDTCCTITSYFKLNTEPLWAFTKMTNSTKRRTWVVRQVVPLPAEEVVIYIDPEEEMVVDQEKEEEVVFVAKTSKMERKKTKATLPIVIGVVGGVVFVLLSLLTVLCIRHRHRHRHRDEAAVKEGERGFVGCPSSGATACGGGCHLY